MAGLLLWETVTWFALVLAALLALLTIAKAARQTMRPLHDFPVYVQQKNCEDLASPERTMSRWSRIVKESNTAFWTHVSNRSDMNR